MNRATMAFGILAATAATSFAQPVQWRVEDGGNGHWYQAFVQYPITWTQARTAALAIGGDLVSLTTETESNWVYSRIASNLSLWNWRQGPWIGLFQDRTAPDYSEPAGGWRWVDGAPLGYTRWLSGAPFVDGGPCILSDRANYLMWPSAPMNAWGSNADDWYQACHVDANMSYIVEWSADCNADGLVDKGQILSGQLQDLDANGVPDICEVPCTFSQHPSNQSLVPGGSATFAATFARAGHSYQWRRNGVALASGGRIGGTTTPTLTIASVGPVDQGSYDCVATGVCGSVPSGVATLSCSPVITSQPQGGTFVGGQLVTLSVVTSAGASYRWRRDGVNLINGNSVQGVTTPTLTINADEPFQSGSYTVAVTNVCGTTVSQAAVVEVTCPADFNQDGGTDGQDAFDFFEAWAGGETSADLNFDGGTDGGDVTAFFARWERGC